MSFDIIAIQSFRRELKKLAKKFPSMKDDYIQFLKDIEENPHLGTPLGNNCYKIRIAIKSKGKGKSGGGRIITYLQVLETAVYLLSIYDKSEKESISDTEIQSLINEIP